MAMFDTISHMYKKCDVKNDRLVGVAGDAEQTTKLSSYRWQCALHMYAEYYALFSLCARAVTSKM